MIRTSRLCYASTLTLWHGGNLDTISDNLSHKKGRWEWGAGLYLTTHWETARKYSKGSRRLYRVTINSGNDAASTSIPLEKALEFIKLNVARSKQLDIKERLLKRPGFSAEYFINVLLNNDALRSSASGGLRTFLVENNVDYSIQDNAFGWNERMIVLFNMDKIIKKEVVRSKDLIGVFDLPTEFE